MPGPGSHLVYGLGLGTALSQASEGHFSYIHVLVYALNGWMGPDLGSFFEWCLQAHYPGMGTFIMDLVHHPIGYVGSMGVPLAYLYRKWSTKLSPGRKGLSFTQSIMLVFAGGISHFALDVPFEENGLTRQQSWILSTGWWDEKPAMDIETVAVVGVLSVSMIVGFYHISRIAKDKYERSKIDNLKPYGLLLSLSALYMLWCVFRTYVLVPRKPAVGEEADLGVLFYIWTYLLLPLVLCNLSKHPRGLGSRDMDMV